jgi:hypothetical protein
MLTVEQSPLHEQFSVVKSPVAAEKVLKSKGDSGLMAILEFQFGKPIMTGKIWLIATPWVILDDVLKANAGGKICFT